jgi:hypothetical protein
MEASSMGSLPSLDRIEARQMLKGAELWNAATGPVDSITSTSGLALIPNMKTTQTRASGVCRENQESSQELEPILSTSSSERLISRSSPLHTAAPTRIASRTDPDALVEVMMKPTLNSAIGINEKAMDRATRPPSQILNCLATQKGNRGAIPQGNDHIVFQPTISSTSTRKTPISSLPSSLSKSRLQTFPCLNHHLRFLHTQIHLSSPKHPIPAAQPSSSSNPQIKLPFTTQSSHLQTPHSSRPTTLAPPRPPQNPALPLPDPDPGPRPTQQPYAALKKNPRFKALSRRWTGVIVALPIALFTTWVLLSRCEFRMDFLLWLSVELVGLVYISCASAALSLSLYLHSCLTPFTHLPLLLHLHPYLPSSSPLLLPLQSKILLRSINPHPSTSSRSRSIIQN